MFHCCAPLSHQWQYRIRPGWWRKRTSDRKPSNTFDLTFSVPTSYCRTPMIATSTPTFCIGIVPTQPKFASSTWVATKIQNKIMILFYQWYLSDKLLSLFLVFVVGDRHFKIWLILLVALNWDVTTIVNIPALARYFHQLSDLRHRW